MIYHMQHLWNDFDCKFNVYLTSFKLVFKLQPSHYTTNHQRIALLTFSSGRYLLSWIHLSAALHLQSQW